MDYKEFLEGMGIELKESYYKQAIKNLENVEKIKTENTLLK
jgi:hypothetical protein